MTERLLRFPERYSLGGLYTAPTGQPETWQLLTTPQGLIVNPENQPINWHWLDEARGDVLFEDEDDVKLQLKLAASAAATLAPLENLPSSSLHVLDMSRSQVPDLGLTHISHISSLRVLELAYTPVGDAGLAFIARLSKIQSLGLTATSISSDGLLHLTALTDLRELWLNGTAIDDDAAEHLVALESLMLLGLSGTKITDKTICQLKALPNLLRLYLFNTQVSEQAINQLRQHLPALRVKWKRPVPTRPEFTLADLVDLSVSHSLNEITGTGTDTGTAADAVGDGVFASQAKNVTARANRAGGKDNFSGEHGADKNDQDAEDDEEYFDNDVHPARSGNLKNSPAPSFKTLSSPDSILSQSQFWQIIDLLDWEQEGDDDLVMAPAVQHLQGLQKEAIAAFEEILCEKLFLLDGERYAREIGRESYRGEGQYFSKEWFLAARCCAVANGQEFFEEVLSDPSAMPKDLGFLALSGLAARAYKAKSGLEFHYRPRFDCQTMSNTTGWRSL